MEKKVFIFSLLISLILHFSLFILLSTLKTEKKRKKESKLVVVSFIKPQKPQKNKSFSAKRKIPKKTKLNPPSKTVISQKKQILENKRTPKQKAKNLKKIPKKKNSSEHSSKKKNNILKTTTEKKALKKEPVSKKVAKIQKQKKAENTSKKEVKGSKNEKNTGTLKLSNRQKEKKKIKPDINVPIQKKIKQKNENEKEKKIKQLNLTHLKGKNEIFQMQSEEKPKKEEKVIEAKGDIKKYLFYVRDRLQENLIYPLMAKRLEIEGTVIVRFIIDKNGYVDENTIKVVKSSGSKILDRQAILTVKNSIPFKPPPNNQKIVIEIPVIFEIIRY